MNRRSDNRGNEAPTAEWSTPERMAVAAVVFRYVLGRRVSLLDRRADANASVEPHRTKLRDSSYGEV